MANVYFVANIFQNIGSLGKKILKIFFSDGSSVMKTLTLFEHVMD